MGPKQQSHLQWIRDLAHLQWIGALATYCIGVGYVLHWRGIQGFLAVRMKKAASEQSSDTAFFVCNDSVETEL